MLERLACKSGKGTHLVLLVLFEVLAGLFLENERRARDGGRTVPGQRRTRRTRRRHRQGIEVPVQEIPIAAVVVVIAGTELYIVQTERFPVFRRRRHLRRASTRERKRKKRL